MLKASELLPAQSVRRKVDRRRLIATAAGTAGEVIGCLQPGDEISGITNGQFSLIDIIEHILSLCGRSRVTISTWTMGVYERNRAIEFVNNKQIEAIRWLVDPSIFARKPELSGVLVNAFGADSFRAVNTHAKWATVRSDRMAVVCRSSMNLNPNKRLENFDISADDRLCAFYEGLVDDIFEKYEHNTLKRSQSQKRFADVLAAFEEFERKQESIWGDLKPSSDLSIGLRGMFD